jgi:F-type H+-transporting ATPase subunit epsilon
MTDPIELTIVTPEGESFSGDVESVVLPGVEGDFGVLRGHEPFLTALRIGGLEVDRGSDRRLAAVGRGFAEISGPEVTVMVSTCEWSDEIDVERAQRARERAQRQLQEMRQTAEGQAAYAKYQDAYSRAVARISISERFKS